MKKFTSWIVAVLLIAMVMSMAGCQSGGETPAPGTEPAPTQTIPVGTDSLEATVEGDGALMADTPDFVPSAEQKPAPEAAPFDEENPDVIAVIRDKDGKELAQILAEDVRIIPFLDRESQDEEIRKQMEEAYASLTGLTSLAEAVPALEETLKAMQTERTAEEMVVRDLFFVQLKQEHKQLLEQEGTTVSMKFLCGAQEDDVVLFLHYLNSAWEIADPATVEIRKEDGAVSVSFPVDMATLAFVVEMAE